MDAELKIFTTNISALNSWSHVDKIKFFAWYIHSIRSRDRFNLADIRACYDALYLEKPVNLTDSLTKLCEKSPKLIIRDSKGYYLEGKIRSSFESKYGQRASSVMVDKMLSDLPSKVPDLIERTFLNEALACFKCGAFRASIVMSWNLAFNHFSNFIISKHLPAFNTQLPKSFPKADISVINKVEDFAELKEFQILQICKSASIITADLFKILKEKLDRRNIAAHPSHVVITQLQAEDFITDMVNNVILKLV